MTPMMALLADHPSEIGCVSSKEYIVVSSHFSSPSVRIGIAFTIIGVGPLFGKLPATQWAALDVLINRIKARQSMAPSSQVTSHGGNRWCSVGYALRHFSHFS